MRRTSVLRRFAGTLPHLRSNAPSARVEAASSFRTTKNRASKPDVLFNMERATRLARVTIVPRHAQRAPNAPLGRFLASLVPCSTLGPLGPKNRGMTNVMPLFFGAGDEARTRYLHLGKVALYQMSYARGTRRTIPGLSPFVKTEFQISAKIRERRLANAGKLCYTSLQNAKRSGGRSARPRR